MLVVFRKQCFDITVELYTGKEQIKALEARIEKLNAIFG